MREVKNTFVVLAVLLSATASSSADEENFTSLFDGKTLTGWKIDCLPKDRQQAATAWTVDQGTLLANTMGHKDHFYILLSTNKEYGDFVLRLRFQVERGVTGNSGIQIRSRYNPKTGWMDIRIKELSEEHCNAVSLSNASGIRRGSVSVGVSSGGRYERRPRHRWGFLQQTSPWRPRTRTPAERAGRTRRTGLSRRCLGPSRQRFP